MNITVKSNIGRRRLVNQDYADYSVNAFDQKLFVLCDGVGGNKAGDVASQMTTNFLVDNFVALGEPLTAGTIHAWILEQIEAVNTYIYNESLSEPTLTGMSTTLVMAVLIEGIFYIGNVGDSRAYYYHNGELKQLTEDHSLVNVLIKSGEITAQEGETHPQRNVVTQSIGGTPTVYPDIVSVPTDEVSVIMLCSDGLTNMVSKEEITNYFNQYDTLDHLGDLLIDAANAAGGADNITLVLCEKSTQADQGGDEAW